MVDRLQTVDVSIVIVNWNTREFLRAALTSCQQHSGDLRTEVIVVDNGSSDGSGQMVREQFPDAMLLENSDNVGYVAACNQAMRRAQGRYFLMLNSDAELTDGCLPEMVRIMDSHYDIGTVGAQLVFPDGSPQPSGHRQLTLFTRLLPPWIVRHMERPRQQPVQTGGGFYDVGWILGTCQLVRAETVAQVGMMDERIYMWWDDADWCLRMARAGWRRGLAMAATCVHHERKSAASVPPLRLNLQISMSEFAYFRINHGRAQTTVLWAVRTLYSLAKVLLLGSAWLLTLGRVGRLKAALRFNWGRARFHLFHAADILWREPQPYRGQDVICDAHHRHRLPERMTALGFISLSDSPEAAEDRYAYNPSPYGTHQRVLATVPENSRVLDVGCAAGFLAEKLAEKGCTVFGIELDEDCALAARKHCAHVLHADVETLSELPWPKRSFDAILTMDLLEHLREPASVLRMLTDYLKPSGTMVITLPNVANWRIRFRLLRGRWDYETLGILDRTHLRFFTLATARELIASCGLVVEHTDVTGGVEAFAPFHFTIGKLLALFRANLAFDHWLSSLFPALFAFQFIFVARLDERAN